MISLGALGALLVSATSANAGVDGGGDALGTKMIASASVNLAADTVTFPLHKGSLKNGQTVWYILTDVSDRAKATELGLEYAPTFAEAVNAPSTRTAIVNADGSMTFEAGTVDFNPQFNLVAGAAPNLFPPAVAMPGSVDESQLSFCNGQVPHNIVHDKVVSICPEKKQVTLKLSHGFGSGQELIYISTDANEMLPATMEVSTYAPAMNDLKGLQVDQTLFALVNGQTGAKNPQRQGFDSALSGDGSPLNILGSLSRARTSYSPLWDIQAAVWSDSAVSAKKNVRLTSNGDIGKAEAAGQLQSVAGGPVKSIGLLVNCPVIGFLK